MSKARIDKIFSGLGLLSRSECKIAAKAGRIRVNGEICRASDAKADPDVDEITLDNERVDTRTYVYYMLYKPEGVITANDDPRAKTVFDLIDDRRTDLSAVGRLDKDTTGILIITNDGALNHRLLSPKYHVYKTYRALIDGRLTREDIDVLESGVDIGDDKLTLPAKVQVLDEAEPQTVELTITEGRYHQVKRMFEAVGKPVLQLHRGEFGGITLTDDLKPGEYRELTAGELEILRR